MQFNTIYLSFKRDPDLIALYRLLGAKQFQKIMKEALRTVARPGYKGASPNDFSTNGDLADILYKHVQTKDAWGDGDDSKESSEMSDIRINLCVTAKKDEDISALLSHVKPLKRGLFIKQVLRFYIGANAILRCFIDAEYIENGSVVFSSCSSEESALFEKMAAYLGGMMPTAAIQMTKEQKTKKKTASKHEKEVVKEILKPEPVPSTLRTPALPSFGTISQGPSFTSTQDSSSEEDDEAEMLALLDGLLT